MTAYSVYVEVGTYSWTVNGDDIPNNAAATYGLADPLVIGQRWPDSDLQPNVQPDPAVATVTIIAADGSVYPLLSIGDPVAVEFSSTAAFAGPFTTFYGRVAAVTANPHDLGVIYSLSCVDYLADLQEPQVGLVDYPNERLTDRMDRLMDEANRPRIPRVGGAIGASDYPSVVARTASPVSLYEYLVALASWWSVDPVSTELGTAQTVANTRGNVTPQLVQNITARRLDPTTPFSLATVDRGRFIAYDPPLRLATVGGLLSVTAAAANSSPATGSFILDAGSVNVGTTFTQSKGGGVVSTMTVSGKSVAHLPSSVTNDWAEYNGGQVSTVADPVAKWVIPTTNIQATVETEFFDSPTMTDYNGFTLIRALFPPNRPDPKVTYDAGTLKWEAWHDTAWSIPRLGRLLTVARVAVARNPGNREWLVGVVSGWQLTVSGGRPTVELETMKNTNDPKKNSIQRGASLGVVRFDSPILGTTTFAQLSQRDSFTDYELVRGS